MPPFTDPALPGLPTALDLDAILELLQRALQEHGDDLELIGGVSRDIQYKPGTYCRLLYQVKLRNLRTGRSARQLLSVQVLRADEGPAALPSELLTRYAARPHNVIRTPMLYLPEPRMVVSVFPLDAALPRLLEALDPSTIRLGLKRLWSRRNVHVRRVTIQPLGYTPQARATVLCEVLSIARGTGVPELRRLVGKLHAYKPAARLFGGAWALWRAAEGRVNLAPPVGYLGPLNLTLQEQVRGRPLPALAHLGSFVRPVREAARAIAAVHGLSLPLASCRTPRKEAEVIHRWGAVLAAICPDLARRVERLRHHLAAEVERRIQPTGTTHGDFHPANVLWDDHHVTLIDLDEMAHGDPLVDVGRFLASLRVSALRVSPNPSALANAGEAFRDAYLTARPGDERTIRLMEAASLLVAAATPFRLQRPGWEGTVAQLVDEAERVLGTAGAGSSGTAGRQRCEPAAAVDDPRRWAADGMYMQTVLDPHIRTAHGADLTTCRASTRRRDRIRYELRGWRGGEKWAHSLEGILWRGSGRRALFQRLEALRIAVEGSPHAPLLPRPVAYLRPLSLVVWESASGTPVSSLIDERDALGIAVIGVARALAALHGAPVDLEAVHPLDDELRVLRQRVERLQSVRPDLAAQAAGLLTEVEGQSRAAVPRRAPVLHELHPRDVLCLGERVAFARVEKVSMGHPFIDVADFVARLTLAGVRRGKSREVADALRRFRQAYLAARATTEDGMAALEAGALVRVASLEAERDPRAATVDHLLACASTRLAVSSGDSTLTASHRSGTPKRGDATT